MKKDFLTGLVLILPIAITVAVVIFLINLLTNPFVIPVAAALDYYDILNKPIFFISGEQVLIFSSKILILFLLALITLGVGILAKWFIAHHIVRFGEYFIHRIPVVNKIYSSVQEIVHTIFGHKEQRFSGVVLVPFPHSQTYSIGLMTSGEVAPGSDREYTGMVSVFVPGTPNPAMGFMLLYRKEQLKPIDMKVQDALKFVISCGVVTTNVEKSDMR